MKDVEFTVEEHYFKSFKDACEHAVVLAHAHGESKIDVLIYSKTGARAFGEDDAVEEYEEDPDASVFKRLIVKVNDQGRVR